MDIGLVVDASCDVSAALIERQQLALLRKTLLRMSAWLNYLSPIA